MKILELLLQNKKVWNINMCGYYWLNGDNMMYTNINTKETEYIINEDIMMKHAHVVLCIIELEQKREKFLK